MNHQTLRQLFDSAEFKKRFHTNAPLGALYAPKQTTFALWAPTAQYVYIHLYEQGDGGRELSCLSLERGENGRWSATVPGDLHGVYYDYDVTVDGQIRRTIDPYARACGVNGARGMVVDLARTNPDGWENDRTPPRQCEDVIYEMHVKDFSCEASSGVPQAYRGKYKAITLTGTTLFGDGQRPTCLDYLKRLGVTHVQLMPVYDYGSVDEAGSEEQYNWGYDPVNYNVPEGSYATDPYQGEVRIRELKEAIAALHKSGMRVIMDVVYNHTYHLDTGLFKTVPWYFYRQKSDGSPSGGSGCGNDLAAERSMCARYILDSVLYWAEEYHIDGFRFDLMGLLPVGLMNRIQRALNKRFGKGEKLIFGEPWSAGRSAVRAGTQLCGKDHLQKLDASIAAFCDDTRDAVKGGLSSAKTPGFVNGGDFNAEWLASCVRGWAGEGMRFKAPSQTISYLSCHDDWTLWDKLTASLDPKERYEELNPAVLRANRLAAAICFFCQGHLFIHAGEEFGRTKLGVKNSFKSPVSINMLDWARAWENHDLVDYYRGLIALRKRLPGLCDKSEKAGTRVRVANEPQAGCAVIALDNAGDSPWSEALLLVNTNEAAAQVALPDGSWEILCDGESSFLWQNPPRAQGEVGLAGVSAMILGRR